MTSTIITSASNILPLLDILSAEDCKKILNKYHIDNNNSNTVDLVNYKLSKLSDQVLGFLGDYFQLTINYRSATINSLSQAKFFVKTIPQFNQTQCEYVQSIGVFEKECLTYQNLLTPFLKRTKIPFCAASYLIDATKCIIVLEELSIQGFQVYKSLSYLDYQRSESIVKTLARFHAGSLIFEELEEIRIDNNYPSEIKEVTYSFVIGQPRWKVCTTACKAILDCVRLLPAYTDHYEIIARKLNKLATEDMQEFIKPSQKYRNVLTHDDLWCNNFMFNDHFDSVLVDFQLCRYTPPALDLLSAFYLNLEAEFLACNFDKFVSIYYATLGKECSDNGLDVNVILPWTELVETLEYYKPAAILEAAMYGTNVYLSKELSNIIVGDINIFEDYTFNNRSKYVTKEFQENEEFRKRIINVLDPLIKVLLA